MTIRLLSVLLLLCVACTEAPSAPAPKAPASASPALAVAPPPAKKARRPRPAVVNKKPNKRIADPAKAPKASKPGKPEVKWDGPVQWKDWEAAKTQAKAERKPICLVVYADWCPRCRELAPIFKDPEVAKVAEGMLMVRQNADSRPAFLEELQTLGGYVPRIFFFDADGSLRDDITSEHPRYPYFYTPRGKASLLASMRAAQKG